MTSRVKIVPVERIIFMQMEKRQENLQKVECLTKHKAVNADLDVPSGYDPFVRLQLKVQRTVTNLANGLLIARCNTNQ